MKTVDVLMYSTAYCPYCVRARMLLESKNIPYEDIRVDAQPELRMEMREKSGRASVPQIWLSGKHVGGFAELWAIESRGELDEMLVADK